MVASVPQIQYAINISVTSYCYSQIFELYHIFRFISYLYIMILSYFLVTRHECTLHFIPLYFQTNLLTSA